jgi:hypothetical protein
LLFPVLLHQFRPPLTALFLIIPMLGPPLPLAVAHHLPVDGVRLQLATVVLALPPELTRRLAANHLLRAINQWEEQMSRAE